jgi:uncharacterized protein (DUF4415 family)
MAKKQSESSARGKRHGKKGKHISDSQIDFSDIPELTSQQLKKARRVGRPKSDNRKQLIAVRLSPKLLADLKKLAKRRKAFYQTLMHELLEKAVKEVA